MVGNGAFDVSIKFEPGLKLLKFEPSGCSKDVAIVYLFLNYNNQKI
jgi:hypothetical protein